MSLSTRGQLSSKRNTIRNLGGMTPVTHKRTKKRVGKLTFGEVSDSKMKLKNGLHDSNASNSSPEKQGTNSSSAGTSSKKGFNSISMSLDQSSHSPKFGGSQHWESKRVSKTVKEIQTTKHLHRNFNMDEERHSNSSKNSKKSRSRGTPSGSTRKIRHSNSIVVTANNSDNESASSGRRSNTVSPNSKFRTF